MGFLRELVKARSKPVLDHRRHEDVVWLSGDVVEVALVRDASAGQVMLRSRRVMLTDPPEVPAHLKGHVRGDTTDANTTPTLDPQATDLGTSFDTWLADWQAWAATDRERRPAWQLHTALQRAMQEVNARPESIELVLASGLLTMPATAVGEPLRTHIVTQPVTVERDESTGDLLVRLAPETSPRLEDTQLLTGQSIFDPTGSRAMQEGLEGLSSPIDAAMPVFLKAWAARSLTVPIEVEGDESDTGSSGRTLTASPALVLRKRGAFALVEYYDRMIAEAERDEVPVPLGLAQLVEAIEPSDRIEWLDRTGASASSTLADDPLFPLPANPEQREIIERLARDSGVVVEGPPGTGKTHTIANLVSALLAQGQRVLVTSEKSQALRVLRDKLPAQMQELCVSITDVGRGGSAELNRSVAEIATRKSSYNAATTTARIDDLAARRDEALSRRSGITERIRSLREEETYVHSEVAPGYAGTAASIVREVTRNAGRNEWLPGPLNTATPALGASQMQALLDLTARSTPERAARLQQALPRIDGVLPPPADLRQMCERAGAAPRQVRPEASWMMEVLAGAPLHVQEDIRVRCERLQAVVVDVRRQSPAMQAAADAVLSGAVGHLWSKTTEIPGLLELASQSDAFVGQRMVEVPVAGRHALDVYGAMAMALHGGLEWRGRFRKSDQQKAVEALGPVATVDGRPATDAESMRVVAEHLRALDCVQRAVAILADLGIAVDVTGSRGAQVNAIGIAEYSVRVVNALVGQVNSITDALRSISPSVPPIRSVAEASALADAAAAIAARSDTDAARSALIDLAESVAECFSSAPSVESTALVDAIAAGDHSGVESALSALDDARTAQAEEELLASLRRQLEDSAPALAALVKQTSTDDQWFARTSELDEAWAWRRAQQWVFEHHKEGLDRRLESDLEEVEADIASLTAQLAAERAWRGCLERMTAEQVQALQAYRGQVANIGKGTGKYAEQYRAAARSAMQVAQGAVPAWVMPLQQVLASIPAEPGAFDVVIVDEASQADIASLFLLWLAPRVIVVGDDKQCAPSEVASGTLDAVFQRLDTYLPDMPDYLRASLTPRDSLFSMLRTRFGQVVRLREHFRCMPEIITWSSNQFYRDAPLVPLRQFGADRLKPLRTSYVEGGVVTGRDAKLTNRPEALAIADAIEACIDDPVYDGKTFGVVVLQGQSQVDLIRNELLERLDGRQWDERRLRIGTPPDFQGDERHVVFLSMVIAPGQRVAARTDNKAQRAFNVAASRAQDQLWLFHSVTPDSLRSTDLRHSLLTYMQATSPAPAEPMPEGVTRDVRHADFDSLFEQRVFLDITARGYHVNPQVEVNSRRIDLVVTGAAGRLAVECDGDAFHTTPEQRVRDLERERELKRCGWEFWRIRESAYYLDPVGALSGLWAELDRRGIAPVILDDIGRDAGPTWAPVELVDDESHTDLPDDVAPEPLIAQAPHVVDVAPAVTHHVVVDEAKPAGPTVVREQSVPTAVSVSGAPTTTEPEEQEGEIAPLDGQAADERTDGEVREDIGRSELTAGPIEQSSVVPAEKAVEAMPGNGLTDRLDRPSSDIDSGPLNVWTAGEPMALFEVSAAEKQLSLIDEAASLLDASVSSSESNEVVDVRPAAAVEESTKSAWEVVDPAQVPRRSDSTVTLVPEPGEENRRTNVPRPDEAASSIVVTARPTDSITTADEADAGPSDPGCAWEIMPRSAIPHSDPDLLSRILGAAAVESVTADGLAETWGVDRGTIRTAIQDLIDDGLMVQVGSTPGPRYELVVSAPVLPDQPDQDGTPIDVDPAPVAEERPVIAPRLLQQMVMSEAKRGPVALDALVGRFPVDAHRLREAVESLIRAGTLVRVGEQLHVPQDAPRTTARQMDREPQEPAPMTSSLPAAQRATAKKLLFAASWGAPVTLARAVQITRLTEPELVSVLDELEREQVLRKESGSGGDTWVRR